MGRPKVQVSNTTGIYSCSSFSFFLLLSSSTFCFLTKQEKRKEKTGFPTDSCSSLGSRNLLYFQDARVAGTSSKEAATSLSGRRLITKTRELRARKRVRTWPSSPVMTRTITSRAKERKSLQSVCHGQLSVFGPKQFWVESTTQQASLSGIWGLLFSKLKVNHLDATFCNVNQFSDWAFTLFFFFIDGTTCGLDSMTCASKALTNGLMEAQVHVLKFLQFYVVKSKAPTRLHVFGNCIDI